jgi:hypothetical protein
MRPDSDHEALSALLAEAIASSADPALERRLGQDPQAYLDLVAQTERAHTQTGEMLRAAVLSARAAGHSWEAIGATLGMTRQAAQQRFGKESSHDGHGSPAPTRVIKGLTAFNEMAVLDEAGRRGWHSVGYGPFYHVLQRDDVQWEHRRVHAWSRSRASLEADGWQPIGRGWFPWTYYARPTSIPAIPEDIPDSELLSV